MTPRELTTWKDKDRLHHRLYPITVSVAALGIASEFLGTGKCDLKEGDYATLHCKSAPYAIAIPMFGPVQSANTGRFPDFIQYHVIARPNQPEEDHGNAGTISPVMNNIVGPIFVEFYEAFKDWVHDHSQPKQTDYWPEVWRFARVVRNAISHGGKIRIDKSNEPAAKWRNLSYTAHDKGRVILGGDLNASDLILLMIEMEAELTRLDCPFET